MKVNGALVFGVKLDRKLAQAFLVSRRVWAEVAFWRSSLSGLPPWSFRTFRYGFRVTTPLVGFSVGVWL